MLSQRPKAARRTPADAGGMPSPRRCIAPYALILAASPVLAAGGAITVRWALALAAAAVLAGVGAAAVSLLRLVMVRDLADRWIATGAGPRPPVAVVARRMDELVCPRERRVLATSLRRLVAAAGAAPRISAQVPTDRRAVTAEAASLELLAGLLADVDTPLDPSIVARVHVLVTDAGSPLYRHTAPVGDDDLHRRLTQILFEIERGV